MACVPLPDVARPELPLPLTIAPSLPTVEFDLELCCKLLPFPVASPPVPLPAGTLSNPAVVALITSNLKTVRDYLDALPLRCPRE